MEICSINEVKLPDDENVDSNVLLRPSIIVSEEVPKGNSCCEYYPP